MVLSETATPTTPQSAIEEDNYSGKFGFENDPKHRLEGPPGVDEKRCTAGSRVQFGWRRWCMGFEANTREAIFEAMQRKETFATSGPRLRVRFFGGFDMPSIATVVL